MMTMPNGGNPITYSTAQFVEEMDHVSLGLIAMGLQPGDRVALISHNNRCEWNLMDHGTLQAGGIDVPIYPTMTPDDYVYILNHSEARFCFVSNADLFQKVSSIQDQVPSLEAVFTFEDVPGARQLVRGSRSRTASGRRCQSHPRTSDATQSRPQRTWPPSFTPRAPQDGPKA